MGRLKEHCQGMQGYDEKGQGSLAAETGKGHQGQQEGLLQVVQQQKEDQEKCGASAESDGRPGNRRH